MMARVRGVMLGFDLGGIEVVGIGLHVHEHRLHLVMQHDVAGGDEGHRRNDDFVTILPAMPFLEGGQRDVQGTGAAVAKDRVFAVVQRGEQ